MESSIAQSIHKGFEKEKWEIKGYTKDIVNYCPPGGLMVQCSFMIKEWLFYFGGSVLEVGRSPVVHPRPPLAGCRVCPTFGAAPQTYGVRHDRVVHSEVLFRVSSDRVTS